MVVRSQTFTVTFTFIAIEGRFYGLGRVLSVSLGNMLASAVCGGKEPECVSSSEVEEVKKVLACPAEAM